MNSYLHVAEIESAIANLAGGYPALCTLRALPNPSAEGRISHALHLSSANAANHPALVLTAGVHAREWGGAEILISFVADLLAAYTMGGALQFGSKIISASAIKALLDGLDVVIFPMVNPDGLAYSLSHDATSVAGWRKNRNPRSSKGDPNRIGVDVNRNFDFLWDYRTAMGRGAPASDNPSRNTFHGKSAFSEPESRNVRWLLDATPNAHWFIDVHSCSSTILYSWGDDQNQTTDSTMNHRNAAWNGQRGERDDEYAEYIPPRDAALALSLAQAMKDALLAVRGTVYHAAQSFGYDAVSGASDDYVYARQWETPPKPKVLAFVIEFGSAFHPVWTEMEPVIDDVCAAMFGFCDAVQALPPA